MARRRRRQARLAPPPRVRIEYLPLEDIQPYAHNPRDNAGAIESVKNSIEEFGFLVPIVLDEHNDIVAGHTRYAAAQLLGMVDVPCIKATHLTEAQIQQFRIIDNKVAEAARWDFDLLSQEMTALQDSGIDFTRFGFTQEEVDCLSDVVAEDCLSGEVINDMTEEARRRRYERRAPSQTRFVCGEVVFFIPKVIYDDWVREVRAACDFDEAVIHTELKRRLGIQERAQ